MTRSSVRVRRSGRAVGATACVAAALIASAPCLPGDLSTGRPPGKPPSALAELGKHLFFDASLSASGRQSCATCHSPEFAYAPPNGRGVQLGGPSVDREGARAVPSLRYTLNRTPVWHREFVANPAERYREGEAPPTGGFGWDGRFDSLHEQAAFPLLAQNEMANTSPEDIASKLVHASYASEIRALIGRSAFADSSRLYAVALLAIERFELEDTSFHPFTSKYDDYLDGKTELSKQEARGLRLFDDTARGNCASCHPDDKGADGSHPLFTDYELEALGVPRNPEIRANAAPEYFDMGLCGPIRTDQASQTGYCGLFKTPTLRNVATRRAFFHNGRFHTLKDVLRFYATRDTDPATWYPASASGAVDLFDDLPTALRDNVDRREPPFTLHEHAAPLWSDDEIEDVLAFLKTLTDRDVVGLNP